MLIPTAVALALIMTSRCIPRILPLQNSREASPTASRKGV